jgi:hypothetical protein
MTNDAVEDRRHEPHRRLGLSPEGPPRLSQTKKVEVVDHERGDQDEHPPEGEAAVQHGAADFVLDVPDDATERPPLPEQQEERQAAGQHVRAPLGGGRDDPGQEALESLPGHQAVLQREQRQQPQIDRQRGQPGISRPRIERLWHSHVPKESDRVEKGEKEDHVAHGTICQRQHSGHGVSAPSVRALNVCSRTRLPPRCQ